MTFDVSSFLAFIVGLAVVIGVIFAATLFAQWIRRRIIWTPVGRFLVRMGLPRANGSISDLREGQSYLVKQSFVDYHGGKFEAGERMTFLGHDYHPYHGGHVLNFAGKTLYLQDDDNSEILGSIWAYLEPVRR
ncbi:MAG TPA: hypothetical protein VIQ24_24070 [Pyrinomonadaceae bacterium]